MCSYPAARGQRPCRYGSCVGTILPVFPLSTVLFPGLVLPLHIFEERYRTLVRELVASTDDGPQEFGVVTLRRGLELQAQATAEGEPEPPAVEVPVTADQLYDVGCTAELRQVTELPDGRFD